MIVESYLVFKIISCAGENPGCDSLHHGYRTVSLYGGSPGTKALNEKQQQPNKQKKQTTYWPISLCGGAKKMK